MLGEHTRARYAAQIDAIATAITAHRLPEPAAAGGGRNLAAARCSCAVPRRIRVAAGTLAAGAITCELCRHPFTVAPATADQEGGGERNVMWRSHMIVGASSWLAAQTLAGPLTGTRAGHARAGVRRGDRGRRRAAVRHGHPELAAVQRARARHPPHGAAGGPRVRRASPRHALAHLLRRGRRAQRDGARAQASSSRSAPA